jgi:hypothetical protein
MTAVRQRISLRRAETVVLCLLALLLAVATVYDTTREVRIDRRLHADLVSWHALTGSHDSAAFTETDARHGTATDVVCGRVPPSLRRVRYFACLVFQGSIRRDGHRAATGGYYLLAELRGSRWRVRDLARYRYGCFGSARRAGIVCTGTAPPGSPHLRFAGT